MRKHEGVRPVTRRTMTARHARNYGYNYRQVIHENVLKTLPYRRESMRELLLDMYGNPSSDYDVVSRHEAASSGTKLYCGTLIAFVGLRATSIATKEGSDSSRRDSLRRERHTKADKPLCQREAYLSQRAPAQR